MLWERILLCARAWVCVIASFGLPNSSRGLLLDIMILLQDIVVVILFTIFFINVFMLVTAQRTSVGRSHLGVTSKKNYLKNMTKTR
jgi:hypothetical protein